MSVFLALPGSSSPACAIRCGAGAVDVRRGSAFSGSDTSLPLSGSAPGQKQESQLGHVWVTLVRCSNHQEGGIRVERGCCLGAKPCVRRRTLSEPPAMQGSHGLMCPSSNQAWLKQAEKAPMDMSCCRMLPLSRTNLGNLTSGLIQQIVRVGPSTSRQSIVFLRSRISLSLARSGRMVPFEFMGASLCCETWKLRVHLSGSVVTAGAQIS